MRVKFTVFLLLLSFCWFSCSKEKTPESVQYIHLAHTRTDLNPEIIEEVKHVNLSPYGMLWLGGDLSALSSIDSGTMTYLDGYFNLSDENTLWALGNHDYMDTSLVSSVTSRPTYYAYHKNGLTFLVLDTQISDCSFTGSQKALIETVCDTIAASSHLIVLHHKLIWMEGDPILENQVDQVSNGPLGSCNWCIFPNNFYADIYPLLSNVQDRGIQVLCIGGDVGLFAKQFEYKTSKGIYFMASGMNWQSSDNKTIVFTHYPEERVLKWEFKSLKDL